MDIVKWLTDHPELTLIGAITVIQIAPIKVDPWKSIAKWIKKCIVGDLDKKIDELSTKVSSIEKKYDERDAVTCRARIQRFGDEVFHGTKHSKEHFDSILLDIDSYESYCTLKNPEFRNNVTVLTTKRIKDVYDKCLKENSFL